MAGRLLLNCIACSNLVGDDEEGIQCDNCSRWQHRRCKKGYTGINKPAYRLACSSGTLQWMCKPCVTMMDSAMDTDVDTSVETTAMYTSVTPGPLMRSLIPDAESCHLYQPDESGASRSPQIVDGPPRSPEFLDSPPPPPPGLATPEYTSDDSSDSDAIPTYGRLPFTLPNVLSEDELPDLPTNNDVSMRGVGGLVCIADPLFLCFMERGH